MQRATDAKVNTDKAETGEQVKISTLGALTDAKGTLNDASIRAELKKNLNTITDSDITGDETLGWQVKVGNEMYVISPKGEVTECFWEEVKDANGNVTEIRRIDGKVTGLKIGDVIGYSAIDGVSSENRTITSLGTVTGLGEGNNQTIQIEAGTWKLLGVENGKLKIISDIVGRTPESGETGTFASKVLKLSGKVGYQNAEEELNRVCGLYGKGKYAESGRSINVEDINKITGYNPNAVGIKNPTAEQIASGTKYNQGNTNPSQYGRNVTYSWSGNTNKKPIYIYTGRETPGTMTQAHNSFNWFDGRSWNLSNYEAGKTGEICKLISNYYFYYPTTLTGSSSGDVVGITTDSDEYKLLIDKSNFGNGDYEYYWLASRCDGADYSYFTFNVHIVGSGLVGFVNLAFSNGNKYTHGLGLRPVVYLQSDIQLKKDNNGVWQFLEN